MPVVHANQLTHATRRNYASKCTKTNPRNPMPIASTKKRLDGYICKCCTNSRSGPGDFRLICAPHPIVLECLRCLRAQNHHHHADCSAFAVHAPAPLQSSLRIRCYRGERRKRRQRHDDGAPIRAQLRHVRGVQGAPQQDLLAAVQRATRPRRLRRQSSVHCRAQCALCGRPAPVCGARQQLGGSGEWEGGTNKASEQDQQAGEYVFFCIMLEKRPFFSTFQQFCDHSSHSKTTRFGQQFVTLPVLNASKRVQLLSRLSFKLYKIKVQIFSITFLTNSTQGEYFVVNQWCNSNNHTFRSTQFATCLTLLKDKWIVSFKRHKLDIITGNAIIITLAPWNCLLSLRVPFKFPTWNLKFASLIEQKKA